MSLHLTMSTVATATVESTTAAKTAATTAVSAMVPAAAIVSAATPTAAIAVVATPATTPIATIDSYATIVWVAVVIIRVSVRISVIGSCVGIWVTVRVGNADSDAKMYRRVSFWRAHEKQTRQRNNRETEFC